MAAVVLADVDQRVLLGELRQRRPKAARLLGAPGVDDRLEGRQREVLLDPVGGRHADRVADADGAQPPDPGHLAGRHERPAGRRAGREDADRVGLGIGSGRVVVGADRDAPARPDRAREQADVGDALARCRPLDLEDSAREVRVRVAVGGRQQLRDPARSAPRRRRRSSPSRSRRGGPRTSRVCAASAARKRG